MSVKKTADGIDPGVGADVEMGFGVDDSGAGLGVEVENEAEMKCVEAEAAVETETETETETERKTEIRCVEAEVVDKNGHKYGFFEFLRIQNVLVRLLVKRRPPPILPSSRPNFLNHS